MGSILRQAARVCLIALLCGGLVNLPALAASRPVGVVVAASRARLSGADASAGANLFPGDYLDTGADGSLRLQVGAGQVYLLASSAAVFVQEDKRTVANLQRGTVGFSTPSPETLAVQTPLGIVHGVEGQRAFGQVLLVNPRKIQVTAYAGTLVVEGSDGHRQLINQGESYEGALPDSAGGGSPVGAGGTGIQWGRVAGVAVLLGGAAIAAWCLWPESNSSPGCF